MRSNQLITTFQYKIFKKKSVFKHISTSWPLFKVINHFHFYRTCFLLSLNKAVFFLPSGNYQSHYRCYYTPSKLSESRCGLGSSSASKKLKHRGHLSLWCAQHETTKFHGAAKIRPAGIGGS